MITFTSLIRGLHLFRSVDHLVTNFLMGFYVNLFLSCWPHIRLVKYPVRYFTFVMHVTFSKEFMDLFKYINTQLNHLQERPTTTNLTTVPRNAPLFLFIHSFREQKKWNFKLFIYHSPFSNSNDDSIFCIQKAYGIVLLWWSRKIC